ncbi:MAG: hypothetical protein ACK4N4_03120 [Burkholderiales bacterium]
MKTTLDNLRTLFEQPPAVLARKLALDNVRAIYPPAAAELKTSDRRELDGA